MWTPRPRSLLLSEFWLDTTTDDPADSRVTLLDGVVYTLVAEGNWENWASAATYGAPDAIMFGSGPHQAVRDMETVYAATSSSTLPRHDTMAEFTLDGGASWAHVEPWRGAFSEPTDGHRYAYHLTGEGHPLKVRWADSPRSDNTGKVRFRLYRGIIPAEVDDRPPPPAYVTAVDDSSPVAYWRLEEGDGVAMVADRMGALPATFTGGKVADDAAAVGVGATLDGSADYWRCNANYTTPQAGSVVMWLKPSAHTVERTVWTNAVSGGGPTLRALVTASGVAAWSYSGSFVFQHNATYLTPGQWFQIAWTWEAGGQSIIVNGAAANYSHASAPGHPATSRFQFGRGYGSETKWLGGMDEVALWDRRLTLAEVQTLYNAWEPAS